MRKSGSLVTMVFSSIDNVVSTVENIHGDIAGNKNHDEERRSHVYGVIKSINGRIGNLVSDFFR